MRWTRLGLVGVIAIYVSFGIAYSVKTPLWQAPDEPAHFNYVRYIAEGHGLPVLQSGDWDAAYLEKLKANKFPPELSIENVRYESHQPPLYYVLAAPVFLIAQGHSLANQVYALRLFSVFLGVLLLLLAYASGRLLFPQDRFLALAVPGFIAGIPQHIAMSAAIDNDILTEVILSASVLVLLKVLRDGLERREGVLLGILLGLGLLTKVIAYVAVPLVLIVVGYRWYRNRSKGVAVGALVKEPTARASFFWLAGVYTLALAIGGWWFVRNALVYGGLDIFARQRHDSVVVGQFETAALGLTGAVKSFVILTYESFWAFFGWMGVPVSDRIYTFLGVLTTLAVGGLVLFLWRIRGERNALTEFQMNGLALLALTLLFVFAGFVQYNLKFFQAQGRYLFPALVPIAVFFVLGLREWFSSRYILLVGLAIYGCLVYIDYISLTKFIVPFLKI